MTNHQIIELRLHQSSLKKSQAELQEAYLNCNVNTTLLLKFTDSLLQYEQDKEQEIAEEMEKDKADRCVQCNAKGHSFCNKD